MISVSGNDLFRQTKVLMGLVVVFVLCQSFTMVTDVFELFCTLSRSQNSGSKCLIPKQVNNLISCGHFMLVVNSTVNFVFYMIYIKEFRDSFLKVCNSNKLLIKSHRATFCLFPCNLLQNIDLLSVILLLHSLLWKLEWKIVEENWSNQKQRHSKCQWWWKYFDGRTKRVEQIYLIFQAQFVCIKLLILS